MTKHYDKDTLLLFAKENIKELDIDLISKAYDFALKAHEGQFRKSGEPYFLHCYEVTKTLIKLKMDSATLAASLLHDVIEDTKYTYEDIKKEFNEEIAFLVESVTKIRHLDNPTNNIDIDTNLQKIETYKKLLLSTAKDIRVIIIKLADRLHNMQTLDSLSIEKQKEIAKETMQIYAPLAHRFGIYRLKNELDDLALKYLQPDIYKEIYEYLKRNEIEWENFEIKSIKILKEKLDEHNLKAEIQARVKNIYSIYQKMKKYNKNLNEIYDILAIRIIVKSIADCYHALGIVHELWKPIDGRIKDYIARPKSNLYRSLHTTVLGPDNKYLEIQIRTIEMHKIAEDGIAAHWKYKGIKESDEALGERLDRFKKLLSFYVDYEVPPKDFMDLFKFDLYEDEIFVRTPKGDIIELPTDSTPIDFAFQIHSDLGIHCVGARVNNKLVPIDYKLKNGDVVDIITSKHQKPSKDWLTFVKTGKARNKIKRILKYELDAQAIELGKAILQKKFRKHHISFNEDIIKLILKKFNIKQENQLYTNIANGEIEFSSILEIIEEEKKKLIPKQEVNIIKSQNKKDNDSQSKELNKKKNYDYIFFSENNIGNLLMKLAKCCNPIPGDAIVGYITKGSGVVIHRCNCPNIINIDDSNERKIKAMWNILPDRKLLFKAPLDFVVENQPGVLVKISQIISDMGINIVSIKIDGFGNLAHGDMVVEIKNTEELEKMMKKISMCKFTYSIIRKIK